MRARQGKPVPLALARLDAKRRRTGIKLEVVAAAAGVTIQTVSRVLHGHTKSANVIAHLKRLIAEAQSTTQVEVAS